MEEYLHKACYIATLHVDSKYAKIIKTTKPCHFFQSINQIRINQSTN